MRWAEGMVAWPIQRLAPCPASPGEAELRGLPSYCPCYWLGWAGSRLSALLLAWGPLPEVRVDRTSTTTALRSRPGRWEVVLG